MDVNTSNFVQNFLRHLGERNLSAITAMFADDVDWFIPGNLTAAPWLGRRRTKADVQAFFELLWKNTEPVSAKIDHILTDDKNAIITGEFSTKMLQTGKIVDSLFSIHMTISDGKIIRYRLLEDSFAVSQALNK